VATTGPRLAVASAGVALAILLGAPAARAEPVSVIYLGFSVTADAPYTLNGLPLPPSLFCVQDCSSAKSAVGGLRVGYFFERLPWLGIAGDVSAWVTGWGIQSPYEVTVYPITPLAIVRARLVKREGFENGRVQPYLAIGPGIFISTAEVTSGYLILGNTLSASTTTADVGLDVRAGMEFLPTDWFGVTIEYRYAYVAPSYTIEGQRIETTFSTNQLSLGLVVHY
jgi:opacity protein-like surface antigen